MPLRYRPMRPKDIPDCVALVAEGEGERYGRFIHQLAPVWARCLHEGSILSVVVEDLDRLSDGVLAVGVSAFITDQFFRDCTSPPLFWIGPRLVQRILMGNSPVLGAEAIRDANSIQGLNLAVWTGNVARESPARRLDLWNELGRSFHLEHMGYKLNEICGQPPEAEVVRYTMNMGPGVLLAQDGHEVAINDVTTDFATRPFLHLFNREVTLRTVGSRNYELFRPRETRIFFSPTEQRLLSAALRGGTDSELAEELDFSLSMVKKLWRSVYDRVWCILPNVLPDISLTSTNNERGREKKQRLLAYLRDNPQEFRPHSRPGKIGQTAQR